eukprot:COSAG06_NODE_106_length_23773_cov_20.279083_26_plen_49_part_00
MGAYMHTEIHTRARTDRITEPWTFMPGRIRACPSPPQVLVLLSARVIV